jgi:hypothetical protein
VFGELRASRRSRHSGAAAAAWLGASDGLLSALAVRVLCVRMLTCCAAVGARRSDRDRSDKERERERERSRERRRERDMV